MQLKCIILIPAFAVSLLGQVSSNQSLNGKYYFRQVMLISDAGANVSDTRTGLGTLTFDGNGTYTVSGQQLVGTAGPAALSGSGTYTVKPGGFVSLSNPLRAGVTVNARLGQGAVVGASTEAGNVFDLFIAIPVPGQNVSASTFSGPYFISTIEFPNGGVANVRDANFKLTPNGAGSFPETTIIGQAANLSNKLRTQTISPITYAINSDGTGTLNFPFGTGLDATSQLVSGVKTIYLSQDGSYFIGGSTTAGGHGLVVGVRAFANGATNASWSGFYFAAGLRYDTAAPGQAARLSAVTGAVNALGDGNSVWTRRTRQSDGVLDASPLITYALQSDGSGALTSTAGRVSVASNGQTFATTGVAASDSSSYEMYFGARFVPQSGTGLFLNPQGVLSAASFAPPGHPISPGEYLILFGTGFNTTSATAATLPFQTTLSGVQVSINGTLAPITAVSSSSPQFVKLLVPYGVTGSTATIAVTINQTKSNTVEVPLAATSPGVFSIPQNGIGDGAIRHADGNVVNASNPAKRSETIAIYLTGLGAVSPAVQDGFPAPSTDPLARVTGPVAVYIGGQLATSVPFKGLTPTVAGLYQLNVQIPLSVGSGSQDVAIQTLDGFTDMVNIAIE
jgi:uncharacterized protein (TIGR03437 family)